jgi:hypothetical protein
MLSLLSTIVVQWPLPDDSTALYLGFGLVLCWRYHPPLRVVIFQKWLKNHLVALLSWLVAF